MTEIKISELSIGDWVMFTPNKKIYVAEPRFTSAPAKITGAYRGREVTLEIECKREFMAIPLSCIAPIPLTPEILEKNGFEENCGGWYNSEARMEFEQYKDGWCRTIGCGEYSIYFIKYVHQLQHALRLAGVGKEIEV